jgi:hypothetical protein
MQTALQLLSKFVIVCAVRSHDDVTQQLNTIIDRQFCDAQGLRLENVDFILEVTNFEDHLGNIHPNLSAPVRVKFDNREFGKGDKDKPSRGTMGVKLGAGIITLSTHAAAKDIKTIGGVKHLPRSSVYFTLFKSTLAHEFNHVLDINTKIPRFQKHIESVRIADEKYDEYKRRYYESPVEFRAHVRQLAYVLQMRLEEKFDRMVSVPRIKSDDIDDVVKILNDDIPTLVSVLQRLKIMPKKFGRFLVSILGEGAKPELTLALEKELQKMQSNLRKQYGSMFYYGA